MSANAELVGLMGPQLELLLPQLDERSRRLVLGAVARAAGDGGITAVAQVSGASWQTVANGAGELACRDAVAPGRIRRPGAGRKKLEERDPQLTAALRDLVEASTRGDPMSLLTWTTLSVRGIAAELTAAGHPCAKNAVLRMLHAEGFSTQGNSRTVEGKRHPDRDAQFRYINDAAKEFLAAGDPVISIDTKKKEKVGLYAQQGTEWRAKGDPRRVRDHDFPDPRGGKAIPYGVYDLGDNSGFVNVGTDHDTAQFAVESVRRWWRNEGALRYPRATRLLVTCDAGGANACRSHLWKDQLALLAAETGLRIEVMHFPPGTSKWNKIEHRLFCHVTRTWRARPLMTVQDAVAGIAATVTSKGLKCTAVPDDGDYPVGLKVPPARIRDLARRWTERSAFHGEWNYALLPAPRPAEPEPEPGPPPAGPDPALLAALAALAGVPAPAALRAAAGPAWTAARELRLHAERGHGRRHAVTRDPYRKLSDEAVLVAAACHARLAMPWALLARLLGVHHTSISVPAAPALTALQALGLSQPAATRARTMTALREHAATAGIPIPPLPERNPQTGHDTPKASN